MPRAADGTYSLPAGNPVVTLTVISSSWANSTLSDLSTAMTGSLARNGDGGMLAGLALFDGLIGAPGLTWGTESTSGLYRAGAGDFRWSVSAADVLKLGANLFQVQGTAPVIRLNETDAPANNRIWDAIVTGEQLAFRVGNDALGAFVSWLTVDRTANAIDAIAIGATALTISGLTTFTSVGDGGNNGAIKSSSALPQINLDESDAAANERHWSLSANGGQLRWRVSNDANSAVTDFMTVDRTGITVDSIALTATAITLNGAAASDFARLSQRNTFTAVWSSGNIGSIQINSTSPLFEIFDSDSSANNKSWAFFAAGDQLGIAAGMSDDHTSLGSAALLIDRTANTIDSISFQAPLLLATSIHNGTATGGSAAGAIASGTYTPTLNNTSNIDSSTSAVCQYTRVGNVVTVSGTVSVDTTTTALATTLGLSLPIASNFATGTQLSGCGVSINGAGTSVVPVAISADTVNDRASLNWPAADTTNRPITFTFTYLIV